MYGKRNMQGSINKLASIKQTRINQLGKHSHSKKRRSYLNNNFSGNL